MVSDCEIKRIREFVDNRPPHAEADFRAKKINKLREFIDAGFP